MLYLNFSFSAQNSATACVQVEDLFERGVIVVGDSELRTQKIDHTVDVNLLNQIITSSYEIWSKAGVEVGSPTREKVDQTASYIYDNGHMVLDKSNQLVAIYNLDSNVNITQHANSIKLTRNGKSELFRTEGQPTQINTIAKPAYFYRFAVKVDQQKNGIGRAIITSLFRSLRKKGFTHLVLDTQIEANWLYNWYLNLGFKDVGVSNTDSYGLTTRLMIKDLREENL